MKVQAGARGLLARQQVAQAVERSRRGRPPLGYVKNEFEIALRERDLCRAKFEEAEAALAEAEEAAVAKAQAVLTVAQGKPFKRHTNMDVAPPRSKPQIQVPGLSDSPAKRPASGSSQMARDASLLAAPIESGVERAIATPSCVVSLSLPSSPTRA